MKRKVLLVILLLICATILPFSVNATTVNINLTGTSGNTSNGFYIDPYFGTVNLVPTDLWCIDFSHGSHLGDSWTANVTELASFGSGGDTYLRDETRYKEMIWLITQYTSQTVAIQKTIQWVIWDISLDNNSHKSYESESLYFEWLGRAKDNWASIDYSGWKILTDVTGGDQEFAVRVPEPGILILLGIGLTSVALVARRKKLIP